MLLLSPCLLISTANAVLLHWHSFIMVIRVLVSTFSTCLGLVSVSLASCCLQVMSPKVDGSQDVDILG